MPPLPVLEIVLAKTSTPICAVFDGLVPAALLTPVMLIRPSAAVTEDSPIKTAAVGEPPLPLTEPASVILPAPAVEIVGPGVELLTGASPTPYLRKPVPLIEMSP